MQYIREHAQYDIYNRQHIERYWLVLWFLRSHRHKYISTVIINLIVETSHRQIETRLNDKITC